MRVLLVNKFYWRSAGAEAVFFETQRLLEAAGHEVAVFAMQDERNEPTRWEAHFARHRSYHGGTVAEGVRDALASVYSLDARRRLRGLLKSFRPQVAHLHNVYHQLSLSVVDELRAQNIPIVMTLHDYKIVCPNYRLLTHDGLCTRCLGGSYRNAVVHRCLKDSRAASLVAAAEAYLMRAMRQYSKIDMLITPSEFLEGIVLRAGFARDRVRVIRNPVVEQQLRPLPEQPRFLYFGRLAPEKGIDLILGAVPSLPPGTRVDVAGTGPSEVDLSRAGRSLPHVTFHGRLSKPGIDSLLDRSTAAVLPARWYENSPMSILEAAARGVPSIASRLGGIPELIEDRVSGFLVLPDDQADLTRTLAEVARNPDATRVIGQRAWEIVRDRHGATEYLTAVERVYGDVATADARLPTLVPLS